MLLVVAVEISKLIFQVNCVMWILLCVLLLNHPKRILHKVACFATNSQSIISACTVQIHGNVITLHNSSLPSPRCLLSDTLDLVAYDSNFFCLPVIFNKFW